MSHSGGFISRSLPPTQPPVEGTIPGIYLAIIGIAIIIVLAVLIRYWFKKQKKF